MRPRTKAFTAAVTGCGVGAAGLAWLAMPASAGEAPQLPSITAEELVQSVLTTKTPAMDGTVAVTNNLGLPIQTLPGGMSLSLDGAHVYSDGKGDSKVSMQQGAADTTIVRDGNTVWTYHSKDNSAVKVTVPADKATRPGEDGSADPAALATGLVGKIRESSTVTVEGTARVAGRAAYELVLTPKPTERTLLREIRVAVDAEKRVPLRLAVMSNGSADPALQVAFTGIEFTPQPASEFQFSPPQGTKVTEGQAPGREAPEPGTSKIVGDGWDTVITGAVPDSVRQPQPLRHGQDANLRSMLQHYGKPVSGAFGSGYVISTNVATVLITDDGRFAAGAVPQQVLVDALGSK